MNPILIFAVAVGFLALAYGVYYFKALADAKTLDTHRRISAMNELWENKNEDLDTAQEFVKTQSQTADEAEKAREDAVILARAKATERDAAQKRADDKAAAIAAVSSLD